MYAIFAKPVYVIVSLAVATSAVTGVKAEESMPGDLLYKYKIHVNENIRGMLTITQEGEARLSLDLAEERLREAEDLAISGELNTESRVDLESRFREHVSDGHDNLAKLKADEDFETASEVAAEFESELKAHEEVMIEISDNDKTDDKTKRELEALELTLQIELATNSNVKEENEKKVKEGTSVDVEAAAEGKLEAAQNKLDSTLKFIDKKEVELDAETEAALQAKIEAAESLIIEGQAELENGNFAEAFTDFQKSHQESQSAKTFLQGVTKIKVEN